MYFSKRFCSKVREIDQISHILILCRMDEFRKAYYEENKKNNTVYIITKL